VCNVGVPMLRVTLSGRGFRRPETNKPGSNRHAGCVGILLLAVSVVLPAAAWPDSPIGDANVSDRPATPLYRISTFAGGVPPATPAPAARLPIGAALGIAADREGSAYFTNSKGVVFKLSQTGTVTVIAGNARIGYSGDGGAAKGAQFSYPKRVAVDAKGNVFISDNHRIRKISTDGIITTVAGNGGSGYSPDGGSAVDAAINAVAVAVDSRGLYVIDSQRVRRISKAGIITTIAGNGSHGYAGDGGPATEARLFSPHGIAIDAVGNLFIADTSNARIRKVTPDGLITTVAGDGTVGTAGDGGPAVAAQLWWPEDIAVDGAGNLLIADKLANRVRKVSPSGIITTLAGTGVDGSTGDGGPATSAQLREPASLAVDGLGNVFILESAFPNVAYPRIRKVTPGGTITTVAGGVSGAFEGDRSLAATAYVDSPRGVAVDQSGSVYISDSGTNTVRRVTRDGLITTVAGNGVIGYSGDGGPATSAALNRPWGLAIDNVGNLLIADMGNGLIRKVSSQGLITTVAGGGNNISGDGVPATSVDLNPLAIAADNAGNIFIGDFHTVRKVSVSGIVTTVAGTEAPGGSLGDGGPATFANIGFAAGLAVDRAGNIFVADMTNNRIRKISTDGIITTVAGNGTEASSGDGGPATSASVGYPRGVAVDESGTLFIMDSDYCRVRRVSTDGVIDTIAGTGCSGYSGDGGPATSASFNEITSVAADATGSIYVVDWNGAVRVLSPTTASGMVGAVADAASERVASASPGKILVIYGAGLGPAQPIQAQATGGKFMTELGGTSVLVNGIPAPILYTSSTQVAVVTPYSATGATIDVSLSYQGQPVPPVTLSGSVSAPSIFTVNQTGSGQAAAINSATGTVNTAANPVRIADYISLYATGEGLNSPAPADGSISAQPLAHPLLPVTVTVGGTPAKVQYAGAAPGQVAGLLQVNVEIPSGVEPGGYVPVVLQVGDSVSSPGVWIAVSPEHEP
jgi:uncharacterized protein (TIGR03437 family)